MAFPWSTLAVSKSNHATSFVFLGLFYNPAMAQMEMRIPVPAIPPRCKKNPWSCRSSYLSSRPPVSLLSSPSLSLSSPLPLSFVRSRAVAVSSPALACSVSPVGRPSSERQPAHGAPDSTADSEPFRRSGASVFVRLGSETVIWMVCSSTEAPSKACRPLLLT